MIRISSAVKTFGSHRALDGLSLEVSDGEIYGLLGPNGAGKTTTIHTLLGLIAPDSGEVEVAGIDVLTQADKAREAVAYVPESVSLYAHLTGVENLDHFTRLAGKRLPSKELGECLDRVGLAEEAQSRRVGTYSKGMRQKVGLAIALAKEARCVLLDEPSSGLDPSASYELSQRTRELAANGVAVLMATHDLFRARETCDRVGLLSGGKIAREWKASEVTATDLESAYLEHVRQGGAKKK